MFVFLNEFRLLVISEELSSEYIRFPAIEWRLTRDVGKLKDMLQTGLHHSLHSRSIREMSGVSLSPYLKDLFLLE